MSTEQTGATQDEVASVERRRARTRELESVVASGMPNWEAPQGEPWNTPKRASFELSQILGIIEELGNYNEGEGLLYDAELHEAIGKSNGLLGSRTLERINEEDADNFRRVSDAAYRVHLRMEYQAGWVPPEGMAYFRQQVGLNLLEVFEAIARRG